MTIKQYRERHEIIAAMLHTIVESCTDCCFNHIIGLPRKGGIEKAIFDYERLLFIALMIPGFLNSKPNIGF